MKSILIALILFVPCSLKAQQVKLITVDSLFQRLDKGQDTTYIINFWATWCGPCLKEIPNFDKLSVEYKNAPLKVLLISVDTRSKMNQTVLPFIRKKNLVSEVFLLNEKDPQEYINRIDSSWSGALPATLIVNKEKRQFFEQEFTYEELVKEYKKIKTYETPGVTITNSNLRISKRADQYDHSGD